MAKTWYKPGSWNAICQRTGFKVKREEIVEEWTGLKVRRGSVDHRNPQDLLKGIPDNPATPWALPRPPETNLRDTNLLLGQYWEHFGDWSALTGTSWVNNIYGDASHSPVQLRLSSMVPVGPYLQVGDVVNLSAVFTVEIIQGGMVYGQLRFYDFSLNLLSTSLAFTFDEYDVTGAFQAQGAIQIPASTAYIQVVFKNNGLTANQVTLSLPSLTLGGTAGSSSTAAWTGAVPVVAVGPTGDGSDGYTAYDLGT